MTVYVHEKDLNTTETRLYFARKVQHRGGLGWECRSQLMLRLHVVPALARLDRSAHGIEHSVEGVHPLLFLVGIRDTHLQGLVHRRLRHNVDTSRDNVKLRDAVGFFA